MINLIITILFFIFVPMASAQNYPLEPKELEEGLWKTMEDMVFVKGGCFGMGDTFGNGSSDEQPLHEVCVDDFHIGKYEVTQGQWWEIMRNNPSYFKTCGDDCPVERVSWNDVQEYIRLLNLKTAKRYRLPTEAEWEYAARSGGKKEKWAGTSIESELGDYAWYARNSVGSTHPVGQKKPNGLGLYDMTGNVSEFVQDWYHNGYYNDSPRNKPTGPSFGSNRVIRGGSWYNYPKVIQSAYRYKDLPHSRDFYYGFRLVMPQ